MCHPLLLLFVLSSFISFGQNNRTLHWAIPNGNGIDFNGNPPSATLISLPPTQIPNYPGGSSAISDADGNFMFFSNGDSAWHANGNVIIGGNGLEGGSVATQNSIFIPSVSSSTRYYLFVLDALSQGGMDGLSYYDIEMTLNSGNGGVVGPTQLGEPLMAEKLAATRHGNDRHYWVVAHAFNSDEFLAYLVDEAGVNTTPVVSAVGFSHIQASGSAEPTGQMKISPDGQWIALCLKSSGYVQLFRFDNETGIVSDPITLASGATIQPFGIEFSADSKKFYYCRWGASGGNSLPIHQFDLDHLSLDCLLDSEQEFTNNDPNNLVSNLQLGPDKKIYAAYANFDNYDPDTLGIINEPQYMSPQNDFVPYAFFTINNSSGGLPNFVSSFLSDGMTYEFGSNCQFDTTWFFPEDTLALDSVRWSFGDPTSGANTSTALHAPHVFSDADTFLVTLYAFRGNQTDTFTREVFIWEKPNQLLGPDTTICDGQPIALNADWYGSCVIWDDNSTNLEKITANPGWHWVDVYHQSCLWRDSVFIEQVDTVPIFSLGNDTSTCSDPSITLDPQLQNVHYLWQDGSNTPTYEVTETGLYWLKATNACGSSQDTVFVAINDEGFPVLNLPSDTTICDTSIWELNVSTASSVYEWNDGSTDSVKFINTAGIYAVTASNACDTVSTAVNVEVDSPMLSTLNDADVVCDGRPLTLLATIDSAIVTWSNGQSGSTITVSGSNEFWFSGQNACGQTTDTVIVLEYDTNYAFAPAFDSVICDPANSVVIGDTASDFPWLYLWSNDSRNPTIDAALGTYVLRAQHRCDTIFRTYNIQLTKPANITDTAARNVCENEVLEFQVSRDSLREILWSTGDTTISTSVSEAQILTLYTLDYAGCVQNDTLVITSNCPGKVFVPNVITPNNDNVNDELCIDMVDIVSYTIHIYDRWGIQVFTTNDPQTCWNGQSNNLPSANGTYFYVVEATDKTGESLGFRGSITLLN